MYWENCQYYEACQNKLMHTDVQTPCVYEDDWPLDKLEATEITILKTKVMLDIYPTCQFVATQVIFILIHVTY